MKIDRYMYMRWIDGQIKDVQMDNGQMNKWIDMDRWIDVQIKDVKMDKWIDMDRWIDK